MRKLTFHNFLTNSKGGSNRILNIFEDGVLRRKGRYQNNALLSEYAVKLNENFNSVIASSKDTDSLVIINDARKEISRVGKRSLITTGLIYEELLQVNRGNQNYEDERNKFFVHDETGNTHCFRNEDFLHLLDLLWAMDEQDADAIEIQMKAPIDCPTDFSSTRYKEIAEEKLTKGVKIGRTIVLALGEEYFGVVAQINGSMDFSKAIYQWEERSLMEAFMKNHSWYDDDMQHLKKYLLYRKDLHYNKDEDDYSNVVIDYTTWEDFLSERIEKRSFKPRELTTALLASEFGFSTPIEEMEISMALGGYGKFAQWQTVAHSNFKRNNDWCLEPLNFYKSEVLKLRSNLLEGSFNE